MRKYRRVTLIWLVLAAILYRGLIPAGFMPAAGQPGHGSLLVLCPHGDMAMHGHDGKGPGSAGIEQCPFGAAAGPALTSGNLTVGLARLAAAFRPDWSPVAGRADQPRLQPPARGPPAAS